MLSENLLFIFLRPELDVIFSIFVAPYSLAHGCLPCEPHVTQDGYECDVVQHKIISLLKTLCDLFV